MNKSLSSSTCWFDYKTYIVSCTEGTRHIYSPTENPILLSRGPRRSANSSDQDPGKRGPLFPRPLYDTRANTDPCFLFPWNHISTIGQFHTCTKLSGAHRAVDGIRISQRERGFETAQLETNWGKTCSAVRMDFDPRVLDLGERRLSPQKTTAKLFCSACLTLYLSCKAKK